MAKVHFDFDVDHWIAGATRFEPGFKGRTQGRWKNTLDRVYEESQKIVHVVTGSLKHSGRVEIEWDGDELEGGVAYGGPSSPKYVDYATQEFARGGEHDFLTPAFVKYAGRLGPVTIEAFEDEMRTWR